MSFESGSVSFVRFNVIGEAPNTPDESFLEKASALLLRESELTSNEIEYGWCGSHVLDEELSWASNVYADCLLLGMKIVTNKIPPAIKKAYYEMELKRTDAEHGGKASVRLAKENLGRRIDEDRREGKFRQRKMFQVLWDFSQQVLYFTGSKSTQDQLCELFERTFGLTLELINAGSRAKWWAEANGRMRDLEDARPTAFAESKQRLFGTWPEYPWVAKSPEARSWLGNEFLMWLPTVGQITTKMGRAETWFDVGVDVECSFGDSGKDTIRNAKPFSSTEALAAFQNGKVPRRSHVQLAIAGNIFGWTLNAESLGFGGLSLPPIENADSPRALFEERITMLRDISATLDEMFEQFLTIRFSAAWPAALKDIRTWIESSGKFEPRQKVVAPDDQKVSTRVANDPKFAKALKGLVKDIGKNGLDSISITTPDGRGVKIDAEGAKRIRENCDHVIKGGKLKTQEIDPREEQFNKLDVGVILANVSPSTIVLRLKEAGIDTGAKLRDAAQNRRSKKIAGIGESAWQKIDDAMSDWWMKHASNSEVRTPKSEQTAPPDAASEVPPSPDKIDQPVTPLEWNPVFDLRPHSRPLAIEIGTMTDGTFVWHGHVQCGEWREEFLDSRPFKSKSECQQDLADTIDRIVTDASQSFDDKQLKTVGRIQDAIKELRTKLGEKLGEKIRSDKSEASIDDWERVGLGDLEIGDATKSKLEKAGLITAGQIARAIELPTWDEESKQLGLSSKSTGAIREALNALSDRSAHERGSKERAA